MDIVTSRPDFSLFENNCQNFVRYLIEAVSPDTNIWSLVEATHKQISNGEESIKPSIPGAYPKFIDSDGSSSSTPATVSVSPLESRLTSCRTTVLNGGK